MLSGLCMAKVTAEFALYMLGGVEKDIHEEYKNIKEGRIQLIDYQSYHKKWMEKLTF